MSFVVGLVLFAIVLALILFFAGRLVDSTVAASRRLGRSTFLISVLLIDFDPENLVVRAVASAEGPAGPALLTG